MPRRGIIKKRKLIGDQKYGSTLIARFISTLLKKGKKNTAERIVYGAMAQIQGKLKEDPLKAFEKASTTSGPWSRPSPAAWAARLPGAHRSRDEPFHFGRRPLADQVRPGEGRTDHDGQAGLGSDGRPIQQGRGREKARRHP